MFIRAGEFHLDVSSGHEQQFQAKALIPHPRYDYTGYANDIAVIEIDGEFEFNEYVQPIDLPPALEEVEPGTNCTVSGWGSTYEGGGAARRLHFVEVPFVDDEDCAAAYPEQGVVSSMLCAGVAKKDACQGDSGGPLICSSNGTLDGVVSWGIGCAQEGHPGVYTQVSYFRDFIYEHTGL